MRVSDTGAGSFRADFVVNRRDLLLGGVLAGTAAVSGLGSRIFQQPPEKAARLDALVPDRVGRWTRSHQGGIDIPAGEALIDRTYDEVVTRLYASASAAPMLLLIAYGAAQGGTTQLHRPDACYPAAGFELSDRSALTVHLMDKAVQATRLTARGNGRTEQILYWSRVGTEFPDSASAQRWSIIRQNLRGSIPDGVLVRISALEEDAARSAAMLGEFSSALIEESGPKARSLLVGEA